MLFCVVDITIGGPAATAQDFGIIDRLVFKVSGITLSSALELYCTVILISYYELKELNLCVKKMKTSEQIS